jgi:hypothetical protein
MVKAGKERGDIEEERGFRWASDSGFTVLDFLPNDNEGTVRWVSPDGSIASGYSLTRATTTYRAVYWDERRNVHTIADELVAAGVDLQGLSLDSATILSTNGNWKVFSGDAHGAQGRRSWIARF